MKNNKKNKKNKNNHDGVIIAVIICISLLLFVGIGAGIYLLSGAGNTGQVNEESNSNAAQPTDGATAKYSDSLYYGNVEESHIREYDGSVLQYADNELILMAEPGTTREQVEALLAPYQAQIVGYIEVTDAYQIQFPQGYSEEELKRLGEELKENSEISDYMINTIMDMDVSAVYPNDKKWKKEWNDTYPEGINWGMEAIHAPEAWEYQNQLSTVNVGVWDNVFAEHKDLHFEHIWQNADLNDVAAKDHGNHVSGTIGAGFNNGIGVCGVSSQVNLYATSFETGYEKYHSDTMSFMAGFTYLINQEKCKVLNLSVEWGAGTIAVSENDEETKAVFDEMAENIGNYLQKLLDMGDSNDFVICKAAGNNNNDVDHSVYAYDAITAISNPDIRDRIIVVGAAQNLGKGEYQIADFSNCGDRVDVAAPGVDIYSTGATNNYVEMSGTSMATPHVSGIAALCFGVNPALDGTQVKRIIQSSAQGAIRYGEIAKEKSYSDLKNYSYPMVNAKEAVEMALGTEGSKKEGAEQTKQVLDNTQTERDVVLVLDRSGSMSGEPLEETIKAAKNFSDTVLEQDTRAAVVAYDSEAFLCCGLTRDSSLLNNNIETIDAGGNTNMYDGLQMADGILEESSATKKIIVLMSDGLPNAGARENSSYSEALLNYAETLKNRGYYVYTLGFFTSVGSYDLPSARQLMEGIASPGLHYEVTSADELVFSFDDIAGQINGTEYVYIRIACPVDVTVTSGDETLSTIAGEDGETYYRTSFGTLSYDSLTEEELAAESGGESESENPIGGVSDTGTGTEAKVLRLNAEQNYDIEIAGYDDGKMDYTVSYQNESGEYDDVRKFPNIPVTSTMKATSNTEKSDVSYLEVDEDGDGTTDKKYKTEQNGTMEEVKETEEKDHTMVYIMIGVAVLLVILLIIVVVVLVRSSGRKKKAAEKKKLALQKQKHSQSQKNAYDVISGAIVGEFGKYGGQIYPLHSDMPCVVGRKSTCNIQIAHKQVSRVHCTIQLLPDGNYQVTDYSENGTYYNNQKLPKHKPCTIAKGALLVIGDADNVLKLQ